MSEMEYNKGTLIEWEFVDILAEYPEADVDDLGWTTDEKFVRIGDRFFEVKFENKRDELDYINNLTDEGLGVYKFETYHYNGGAHWTELVERNLKELSNGN